MEYKVAFFSKQFTERGTERLTYDYADFNEIILGNKSFIICFNELTLKKKGYLSSNKVIKNKFKERFDLLEISNIKEIKDILLEKKISHFYVQSHGCHKDIFKFENKKIWNNCKTIYHCAFGPMARQGSTIRCPVGGHLNKLYKKRLPILPPLIRAHEYSGDLREKLKIPKDGLVIGRHGGKDTFDIPFVKNVIKKLVEYEKNIYFLFLNTDKFLNHKNVIHLDFLVDENLPKFIDSCDAMIHGRFSGETFGSAVGEFSAANKPVITFSKSRDIEHIKILKDKALLYRDEKELFKIFEQLPLIIKENRDWNAYINYQPEKVMKEFEKICLKSKDISILDKIVNFLFDFPWEIRIFIITKTINPIRRVVAKILPKRLKLKKNKIKKLLNNYFL